MTRRNAVLGASTPREPEGRLAHGLDVGAPSQLSDVFRQGVAWASQHYEEEKASRDSLIREIDAIVSTQPAEQASLCDLVAPIRQLKATCDRYLAELRRVNDLCLSELGMGLVDVRVLPQISELEAWVGHTELSAFMTLTTAVDASAPDLFKWNNPFAWSYSGDVTDSIREKVKMAKNVARGSRVV